MTSHPRCRPAELVSPDGVEEPGEMPLRTWEEVMGRSR